MIGRHVINYPQLLYQSECRTLLSGVDNASYLHATTGAIMPISIIPPAPAPSPHESDSSDNELLDFEGDVDMADSGHRPQRARYSENGILTPGESITDDVQWMR